MMLGISKLTKFRIMRGVVVSQMKGIEHPDVSYLQEIPPPMLFAKETKDAWVRHNLSENKAKL